MKYLYGLLICLWITAFAAWQVNAQEAESLAVSITTDDGKSIACPEGYPIYSSVPVVFTPLSSEGENHYSISIDDGKNFGGYAKMENAYVTLFPDDATAPEKRWQIRFKNVSAQELQSCVYSVVFDDKAPKIEFVDPEVIEEGSGGSCSVHFKITDNCGISRVIASCSDTVLFEDHMTETGAGTEYDLALDLKKTKECGNEYDITAVDVAGNRMVLSFEYAIDDEPPTISVDGVSDGARLGDNASLKIKAGDVLSHAYINYVVSRTKGDEVVSTEVSTGADSETISFDDEGSYLVEAYATDDAGNRSVSVYRKFVIDKSAPTVSIGGVSSGADIRNNAQAFIDVEDEGDDGTEVDITLRRTVDGDIEDIPIRSYETGAHHDIRSVDIKSDGEYLLSVNAKDRAGNHASASCSFRVDKTAPDISVYGLNEGEITGGKPVIRFCAGELFYNSTIMTTMLEKKDKGGYVLVDKSEHVMKALRDHVDVSPDNEGEYRLTCMASDRSGNVATKCLNFTVDRTPPVIAGLSDVDGKVFKSFSLPQKLSRYVSDLSAAGVHAYVNDREIGNSDVIIEEGKYTLTILADDAAGNASEASAVFMVDHTAPQIVLEGFDRDGNVRKGSLIKVGLVDKSDRLTAVLFNGMNIAIDGDNAAYIPIEEYGQYRLCVKAEDDAGNVTDTEINTGCYMLGVDPEEFTKTLSTVVYNKPEDASSSVDVASLCVGLLSVLSGTFGLTYRTLSKGS